MKKTFNSDKIINELSNSVFFRKPATPVAPQSAQTVSVIEPERTNARAGERPNGRTTERTNARTGERPIKRQSYEIFTDQHEALIRIVAEGRMSGKQASISEMVREAIDAYLRKRKQ